MFWRAASVSYANLNDPYPIADKLPNDYQSLLVVVVVVAVMPNDYHMVVVAAVVVVMPKGCAKAPAVKSIKRTSTKYFFMFGQ